MPDHRNARTYLAATRAKLEQGLEAREAEQVCCACFLPWSLLEDTRGTSKGTKGASVLPWCCKEMPICSQATSPPNVD